MTGDQADEEQLVRKYLLGEASVEGQGAVERLLMTEEQYLDTLVRAEEDLIDGYVNGQLSDKDKRHFESYFLNNRERRDQVEFARALSRFISSNGGR